LGQTDSSLGLQNHFVILSQPIHARNYIFVLGVYDDEVQQKVFHPYGNTNCRAYMLSLHFTSGELTIMVYFMMVMGRLCFATNFDDMKKCDALESKKIVAGYEFAWNIPKTTSWNCCASLTVTWLTLP
jgi:hypothetical protein